MTVGVAGLPQEKKGSFCKCLNDFLLSAVIFTENVADRMLVVRKVSLVQGVLVHQLHRIHLGNYI